ncbi:hypothetical protein [Pseudoduganella buxea]|uniref:Uncharacterized protein n=1 Tax=Pseudoduganella buxea TaxID=1949069 RepID=A0A6I3T421_9BURK|nr:hypothetical protein [Pseudoduganella buxea]MTV55476.1 hypothetical protein [Pseudoduganella buxea]GGC17581.1 hypothetical protein GCM10011572_43640 [Pseudoduganella buxea]
MHVTTEQSTTNSRSLPRSLRMLAWLCVAVFALGMLLSSVHHHDLGDTKTDCVSCHAAGNLLADVPPMNAVLMDVLLAVAYVLARQGTYVCVRRPSYLIPARQAPPAASSSSF